MYTINRCVYEWSIVRVYVWSTMLHICYVISTCMLRVHALDDITHWPSQLCYVIINHRNGVYDIPIGVYLYIGYHYSILFYENLSFIYNKSMGF